MDIDDDSLHISSFISESIWNYESLITMLSTNLNSLVVNIGSISPEDKHHLVWFLVFNINKVSTSAYNFLNSKDKIGYYSRGEGGGGWVQENPLES